MKPEIETACSNLLCALAGVRRDLPTLEWMRAARELVEKHSQAIFELGQASVTGEVKRGKPQQQALFEAPRPRDPG